VDVPPIPIEPQSISIAPIPSKSRHLQKCSTLQHHSPRLQQTSSQRTTVAPGKADPASSERRTRVPVVDVGGEPDGHVVRRCSPAGQARVASSQERRRPGGTGRGRGCAERLAVVLIPHSSQDLIAASGVWFCLLCRQPEPVPKSFSASSSQLPLQSPCRPPFRLR
jgi:hypothetical protein